MYASPDKCTPRATQPPPQTTLRHAHWTRYRGCTGEHLGPTNSTQIVKQERNRPRLPTPDRKRRKAKDETVGIATDNTPEHELRAIAIMSPVRRP